MSSSGWVFLVMNAQNRLGVMSTFGPGTLLIRSRTPMVSNLSASQQVHQVEDTNSSNANGTQSLKQPTSDTASSTSSGSLFWKQASDPVYDRQANLFRDSMMNTRSPRNFRGAPNERWEKIGERLYPLFSICIYEHAWMSADYGVWGLDEYIRRFWTVIDWSKVSTYFHKFSQSPSI